MLAQIQGRERAIVDQTNTWTVSKATERDTGWSAYGLFRAYRYYLELHQTELKCQAVSITVSAGQSAVWPGPCCMCKQDRLPQPLFVTSPEIIHTNQMQMQLHFVTYAQSRSAASSDSQEVCSWHVGGSWRVSWQRCDPWAFCWCSALFRESSLPCWNISDRWTKCLLTVRMRR